MFKRSVQLHLLALSFYLLTACLGLYRLLFNSGYLPGIRVDGYWVTDYFHFHWSYWWIGKALSTPGLSVYETNYVMFPWQSNLAFHTMAPIFYPIWAITEPIWGTITAVNIIMIIGLTLTGYTFFALARLFKVKPAYALIGGLALQFTPASWNAVFMSTLHYISIFWLPIHLICWHQATDHRLSNTKRLMWAILLGVAFWGTVMTDPQTLIYTATLMLPYGIYRLATAQTWRHRLDQVSYGLVAIGVLLAIGWFIAPFQPMLDFERDAIEPGDYAGAFDIDFPDGFFTRIPEYWLTITNLSLGSFVLPATMITTAIGLWLLFRSRQHKQYWLWLLICLPPLLLSAGGTIEIFGSEIPMPYRVVHDLFGGMFRQPARFANAFIIAGMLFCGLVWGSLTGKRTQLWLSIPLVVIVMADVRLYESIPIHLPPTPYTFYETIGEETGDPYDDYVVVEVPTAGASGEWGVGAPVALATQFYGVTHHKRMINGLIARVPNWHWLYLETSDPMLSWLGQRRLLEPDVVEAQLRERIYDWPIGYIVIHQDFVGLHTPTNQEIIGYFNQLDDLLCPFTVEGDAVVFRTRWHPDGCPSRTPPEIEDGVYHIDIGADGDEKFIGWGFHWQEPLFNTMMRWTGQYPQTDLYVDLPQASYAMSFEAQAFVEERVVDIVVNGELVDTVQVSPAGLGIYRVEIPAAAIGSGHHIQIRLAYDDVIIPNEAGINPDPRPLALMLQWVQFDRLD